MRAILAVLGVLGLAASASAAVLKVPQQYDTIQEALNAASDGDTIVVGKGVYYEILGVEVPNLKLVGKKAILDGTFEGVGLTAASSSFYDILNIYSPGVSVQGFTFRNGYSHVSIYAPGCSVTKCVSRNAANNGVYVSGYDGTVISGNRIVGCGNTGIYVNGSSSTISKNAIRQAYHGIQVYGWTDTVDGNTITNLSGGKGIYASGSAATVNRNRVANTGGSGIEIYASDSTLTDNRVSWTSTSNGIYLSGDRGLVRGNAVTASSYMLQAYGNDNTVLDNRCSLGVYGVGIEVGGDATTVSGNAVQHMMNYGTGFYIYNYSSVGGSVVSGNTAQDTSGPGIVFSNINNSTVSDCDAADCGAMGDKAGFVVYGSGTAFTDCTAKDCHGDGFYVNATGDTFTSCTATNPTINGFRVYGSDNTFSACIGKGSGGQGFNNGAVNTVMSGGVFLENRLDVADQVGNGATFSGGLGSVLFDTGGELAEPPVYYYVIW